MIRDLVLDREPTKPTIGEVHLHITTQRPLRAHLAGGDQTACLGWEDSNPEAARRRAKTILGAVAHGHDPAGEKATERGTLTISELADRFMSEHVEQKRKPGTAVFYRHLLDKVITPELGATKADKVTRRQVARLHGSLKRTPFQANRVLAVIGSMYTFAGRSG